MSGIITLKSVGFSHQSHRILKKIELEFPQGKTTVIMGSSGSGKTTLVKIAAGLLVPDQGEVCYRDKELSLQTPEETILMRRDLGFVFQDGALWANKTVRQNLELPLQFHFPDLSPKELDRRIAEWTSRFSLDEELDSRPSQLSLGEQKLVSLIRGAITEPEVLILDEPASSLDSQSLAKLQVLLEELKETARTVIMVNQIPQLTARVADHLVLVKSGQILRSGDFNTLVRDPDPQVVEILTSVLSQAATFSSDILDLLGG